MSRRGGLWWVPITIALFVGVYEIRRREAAEAGERYYEEKLDQLLSISDDETIQKFLTDFIEVDEEFLNIIDRL